MLSFTPKQLFSVFSVIKAMPPDPILGIGVAFNKCTNPKKVNLGIGAYRDDEGKPIVMKAVQEAVSYIAKNNMNNEYQPPQGNPEFIYHAQRLAMGDEYAKNNHIATVQSVSGSGGIRLAFELLLNEFPERKMYFPEPTWGNHEAVADRIKLNQERYRYYNTKTLGLDIDGAIKDLEKLPEKQLILLQASGFNPVGVDPSKEEWKLLRDVVEQKKHIACFDMAYQGFITGDLAEDAWGLRYFAQKPQIPLMFIQSFSKNFGLYGQRCGCVSAVCENEAEKNALISQWNKIAREQYSMAPVHGARVVAIIMNNPAWRKLWEEVQKFRVFYSILKELKQMASRITSMRTLFRDTLVKCGSKRNWDHIVKQKGMFAYTGVSQEQAIRLRNEFHVYLLDTGRISIAGLNTHNCEYAAKCFHEVTK